jgi:hypothetical protein
MLESGMAESGAEVIPIRDLPYAGFYALLQVHKRTVPVS